VTLHFLAVRSAILATAWLLVTDCNYDRVYISLPGLWTQTSSVKLAGVFISNSQPKQTYVTNILLQLLQAIANLHQSSHCQEPEYVCVQNNEQMHSS